MAILTPSQLISASNATYFDNVSGSITPTSVRSLNDSWVSSSILVSQTSSLSVLSASYAGTASVLLGSVVSASYALSSSFATTASYALNSVATFPYTGSAIISGSLSVTGSLGVSGIAKVGSLYSNVYTNNIIGDSSVTAFSPLIIQPVANQNLILTPDGTGIVIINKTLQVTGSLNVSGSLNVTGGITGSLQGTASYASQALSSSYAVTASYVATAQTASYVVSASYAISSSQAANAALLNSLSSSQFAQLVANNTFTGNNVFGNVTASNALITSASVLNLYVQYETASVIYSSGSNQFGDAANDVQTLFGTVDVKTGPLKVSGSASITGSLQVIGSAQITGSLKVSGPIINDQLIQTTNGTQKTSLFSGNVYAEAGDGNFIALAGKGTNASLTWPGPLIFANDASTGNTDVIGFQPKGTYTDGRVTILTPLIASSSIQVLRGGITGSLLGTASVAISSSYAQTASFYGGSVVSASYALSSSFATTASYVVNAVSASRAISSSFAATASALNVDITFVDSNHGIVLTNGFSGTNQPVLSVGWAINPSTGLLLGNNLRSILSTELSGSTVVVGTFNVTGSAKITGSLGVTNGITGSLQGTASYARQALSSSYAITASYALNSTAPFPYTGSATITGSLDVTGSLNVSGSLNVASESLFANESIKLYGDASGPLLDIGKLDGTSPYPGMRLVVDTTQNPSNIYSFFAIDNLGEPTQSQNFGFSSNTFTGYPGDIASVIYGPGRNNMNADSIDTFVMYYSGSDSKANGSGKLDILKDTSLNGSLNVSGAVFINNSPLQIIGPGVAPSNYVAPNTILQLVGSTDTIAIDMFSATGSYDSWHVEVVDSQGTKYQDVNASTFLYETWLSVPSNTGNNPAPIMPRGLEITGSLNVTGSANIKGNLLLASGSNKTTGIVTLNGGNPGSVTVSNSLVASTSMIFLTKQTLNHPNGYVAVSSKGSGTFTITSNHNGDTDLVAYMIVNPG